MPLNRVCGPVGAIPKLSVWFGSSGIFAESHIAFKRKVIYKLRLYKRSADPSPPGWKLANDALGGYPDSPQTWGAEAKV
jgi:hypothetical protein